MQPENPYWKKTRKETAFQHCEFFQFHIKSRRCRMGTMFHVLKLYSEHIDCRYINKEFLPDSKHYIFPVSQRLRVLLLSPLPTWIVGRAWNCVKCTNKQHTTRFSPNLCLFETPTFCKKKSISNMNTAAFESLHPSLSWPRWGVAAFWCGLANQGNGEW